MLASRGRHAARFDAHALQPAASRTWLRCSPAPSPIRRSTPPAASGSITAATLTNSQIYAGGLNPLAAFPPAASSFPAVATITSVNLKKIRGVFSDVNSSIAASHITHLSLGTVEFDNGGIAFGVEANVIQLLSAVDPTTGKPFTFTRLTSAQVVTDDLLNKGVTPQDFAIEII